MKYIGWAVSWIVVQRLLMFLHLTGYSDLNGTVLYVGLVFLACLVSYWNPFCIVYVVWILRWGIRLMMKGTILAGILVIVFDLGLYGMMVHDMYGKEKNEKRK